MPLSHGHQLKVEQEEYDEHDEYVGGRVKEEVFMGVSMAGVRNNSFSLASLMLYFFSQLSGSSSWTRVSFLDIVVVVVVVISFAAQPRAADVHCDESGQELIVCLWAGPPPTPSHNQPTHVRKLFFYNISIIIIVVSISTGIINNSLSIYININIRCFANSITQPS